MRKSIAIDMDQVLANFYKKLCATCNEHFALGYTDEQFLQTRPQDFPPEQGKRMLELMNEPVYFRDLEVLDADAAAVIVKLQENYDVFIATAAMEVPGSFQAKYDWLHEHFPMIDKQHIVFCGTKSIIHTDYLIDDSPYQLKAFKGTGILYTMPYNEHVEGYTRVKNWQEIATFFEKQLVK